MMNLRSEQSSCKVDVPKELLFGFVFCYYFTLNFTIFYTQDLSLFVERECIKI
jgi:hypothetical protein